MPAVEPNEGFQSVISPIDFDWEFMFRISRARRYLPRFHKCASNSPGESAKVGWPLINVYDSSTLPAKFQNYLFTFQVMTSSPM
jgi:hypothetical protein